MSQYETNYYIHGPLAEKMVRKYLQLHGAAAPDQADRRSATLTRSAPGPTSVTFLTCANVLIGQPSLAGLRGVSRSA